MKVILLRKKSILYSSIKKKILQKSDSYYDKYTQNWLCFFYKVSIK